MASNHSALDGIGGNGAKVYQCIACGGLITSSDRLIRMGTGTRHEFVNPAGVRCDFHTFFSCPGAVAHTEATEAHTWFPGYRWSLAFCRRCGHHLGWHYEATSLRLRPREFWGILATHLSSK
jgi:cereblon